MSSAVGNLDTQKAKATAAVHQHGSICFLGLRLPSQQRAEICSHRLRIDQGDTLGLCPAGKTLGCSRYLAPGLL